MTRTKQNIPLFVEIVIIVILAFIMGTAWNYHTLRDMLSGKAGQSPTKNEPAPSQPSAVPLPLGLQQAKELYDKKKAVFVDARDKNTYTARHIKGAISLPLENFEAALNHFKATTSPNATLIVYCSGFDCHDSMDVGGRLIKAGYANVYVYLGGFPEWKDAGYAIEGVKP